MSAVEPLCRLLGVNIFTLTKEESTLLEAELFIRICDELKEKFREQLRNYFRLMKFTIKKENEMLEANFVRFIIKDIISTDEYDLLGVACYTDTHEDVIREVISGRNTNPSAKLLRKSISLHRSVRRDLYCAIMKKIFAEHLITA